MKQNKKVLFAIYKNSIHLGNSYGRTKEDAIKNYLVESYRIQFPDISIEEIFGLYSLKDFYVVKALENTHYVKSKLFNKNDL